MTHLNRPSTKHINETKIRLDDEYDEALTSLAKIHRTPKSVLAREALKSWISSIRGEIKRTTHSA